jgi:hypothetical protein
VAVAAVAAVMGTAAAAASVVVVVVAVLDDGVALADAESGVVLVDVVSDVVRDTCIVATLRNDTNNNRNLTEGELCERLGDGGVV